nr:hypothetical protein GCM10020093_013990 [Planobispora longispora]
MPGALQHRMVDPRAPGTRLRNSPAMGPVIGSRSLKATRKGPFQARRTSQASRFGWASTSSGSAGTRPGMARGPAL